MADTISFRGSTFWNGAGTGAHWDFIPGGGITEEPVEVEAPLGNGVWLKEPKKTATEHRLVVGWKTDDPKAVQSYVASLANGKTGTLNLPEYGSYSGCRLLKPADWDTFKTSDTEYITSTTLTFRQYP